MFRLMFWAIVLFFIWLFWDSIRPFAMEGIDWLDQQVQVSKSWLLELRHEWTNKILPSKE